MNTPETSIAFCGHAKHGKTTVMGKLLVELGGVSIEEVERNWKKAPEEIPQYDKFKKDFNKFNYILLRKNFKAFKPGTDNEVSDPSRTTYPTRGRISAGDRLFSLIDQPGLSRFFSNIIYGLYLADFAILLVEAKAGIESQSLRILKLLKGLRVPLIGICITKMDEIGFSKNVFDDLSNNLIQNLKLLNFKWTPPIIPVYALSDSINKKNDELSWYEGQDLVSLLKSAELNYSRKNVQRLRFSAREHFTVEGIGTTIVGVLETGILKEKDELFVEPYATIIKAKQPIRVKSIQLARAINEPKDSRKTISEIAARHLVAINIDVTRQEAREMLKHGAMMGIKNDIPIVANKILAHLLFFSSQTVYNGREYRIRTNACDGGARIEQITSKGTLFTDLTNEEKDVNMGETVQCVIYFHERPLCIEADVEFSRLTRFVLFDHNEIVACGRCLKVIS